MTSRSLNIINDTRSSLYTAQLRSNVVPIIEFIGKQQAFVNETEKPVEFSEIVRQVGTENVNYIWPSPSVEARLPPEYRFYSIQIAAAGYYLFTFQYTFNIITEVYARLNVYQYYTQVPETNRTNRFFPQLLPLASSGSVTWTQYIDAGEVVSISLNSAANMNIIPNINMFSPSLTIVQLSQFYTNTTGYKSTIAKNTTTQTFTTGVGAALIGDVIPGASSGINMADANIPYFQYINNEGGGNQLGGVPSSYNSISVSRRLVGQYYIEAQITITGSTGVGIGGRYAMILAGTTVIASKFLDPLNSGDRHINVSTVAYFATVTTVSVQVLQTSGVSQTTVAALCHLTVIRMGD